MDTDDSSSSSSNIIIGSSIQLRFGNNNIFNKFIKSKCTTTTGNCDNWEAATDLYTTISAPAQPIQPLLVISGADSIGKCDTLTLDFSLSIGKAGRPWAWG